MVAYSSGRPVGPDGNPIDIGPQPGAVQSLLGTLAPDTPPPENPAVLQAIENMRQGWQRDVDAYNAQGGNGLLQYGTFSPGRFAEQAMQPGMSGYFDLDPIGSITPKIFDPRQVAAQSGETLGQLAGSIYPGGVPGFVGYGIPNDDQSRANTNGGFFRLQDLSALRQGNTGGSPISGAAQIGENLLSTNNWRLLGMGPGWIMRNGKLINARAPSTKYGFTGAGSVGNFQAEGGAMGAIPNVAPFNALTGQNLDAAFYWPGAESYSGYGRWPIGNV